MTFKGKVWIGMVCSSLTFWGIVGYATYLLMA
jgi:hypothetical protein